MKYLLIVIMAGFMCCCSTINIPDNEVFQNEVYDIPLKSQVLIRIELTGSYTASQVRELCEMMVRISNDKKMKYHPKPTHIWVFIYKSKADFENDATSWIAQYRKVGDEDKGEYTYR